MRPFTAHNTHLNQSTVVLCLISLLSCHEPCGSIDEICHFNHCPYTTRFMQCSMSIWWLKAWIKGGTDLLSRRGKSVKIHYSVEGKSSLFKMIIYWGIKLYLKFVFPALISLLNPIFMTPKFLLNNFNWKSNFKLNICETFSWFSDKPDLPAFLLLFVLAIIWDTHTHTYTHTHTTSVQLSSPKLWIHLCLFFLTIPNIQATGTFLKYIHIWQSLIIFQTITSSHL